MPVGHMCGHDMHVAWLVGAVILLSQKRDAWKRTSVNRRLDLFGILVLSFVAGNFGGISRDVLIGAVPPAALTDGRYLLVSVLAGLVTFFLYAGVDRLHTRPFFCSMPWDWRFLPWPARRRRSSSI